MKKRLLSIAGGVLVLCCATTTIVVTNGKPYYEKTKRVTYKKDDPIFSIGETNNGVGKYGDDIDFLTSAVPSERQLKYHELGGYYNFIHFGINTFTDREWGDGKEDLSIFKPTKLNTDSWCETLKASGSKGVILTAKHHDGFCLFPSDYTDHDISSTPYKNGTGDIVKELAESCQKYEMKMGIYLSPWDMHEQTYGTNEYNLFFKNQLKEVLNSDKYGEIFEVWFDGARGQDASLDEDFSYDFNRSFNLKIDGKTCKFSLNNLYYKDSIEGIYETIKEANETSNKKIEIRPDGTCTFKGGDFGESEFSTTYLYNETTNEITFTNKPNDKVELKGSFNESYFEIIRKLQPNAVISVIGPDVRWAGNEEGDIDPNIWNVMGTSSLSQKEIEEMSQHSENEEVKGSLDIESRKSLLMSKELIWNPVESDVKNRGSWFYHKKDKVKSVNKLLNLYYKNVGRNGNLLLNVPPTKDGLFNKKDERILRKFGKKILKAFENEIDYSAKVGNTTALESKLELEQIKNPKLGTGYHFENDEYILDLDFAKKKKVKIIVLSEDITCSQRVENYSIFLKKKNGSFVLVSNYETIGTKRIIALNPSQNNNCIGIRLVINQSRNNPVINSVKVY